MFRQPLPFASCARRAYGTPSQSHLLKRHQRTPVHVLKAQFEGHPLRRRRFIQPPEQIIDSHFHLWSLTKDGGDLQWIRDIPETGPMACLKKDYLVNDYITDVGHLGVVAGVHVEACRNGNPLNETRFVSDVIKQSGGFPQAVVAYVDFSKPDVERLLDEHLAYPNVRGVRQVLNWSPETSLQMAPQNFLSDPRWVENVGHLQGRDMTFDLHIWPHQFAAAGRLARRYPGITFVLDHLGCPFQRDRDGFAAWRKALRSLAENYNVMVKISGLNHPRWTERDFSYKSFMPYVDTALELFTARRCMFGSNFPVDSCHSTYADLLTATKATFSALKLTTGERRDVFHDTAARTYRIPETPRAPEIEWQRPHLRDKMLRRFRRKLRRMRYPDRPARLATKPAHGTAVSVPATAAPATAAPATAAPATAAPAKAGRSPTTPSANQQLSATSTPVSAVAAHGGVPMIIKNAAAAAAGAAAAGTDVQSSPPGTAADSVTIKATGMPPR